MLQPGYLRLRPAGPDGAAAVGRSGHAECLRQRAYRSAGPGRVSKSAGAGCVGKRAEQSGAAGSPARPGDSAGGRERVDRPAGLPGGFDFDQSGGPLQPDRGPVRPVRADAFELPEHRL